MSAVKFISAMAWLAVIAHGAITSVSVERSSQDRRDRTTSYPATADLWTVATPPYPLQTDDGIGRLLNTTGLDYDIANQRFTLHGHAYETRFEPVTNASITYGFDEPTAVGGLEIVQHMNGITGIEGFVGNSLDALHSIGTVVRIVPGSPAFTEGEHTVFAFTNTEAALFFRFAIRMTRLEDGYAAYRAFPRKPAGWPVEVAMAPPAKPDASLRATAPLRWIAGLFTVSLLTSLAVFVLLWRDRRRQR